MIHLPAVLRLISPSLCGVTLLVAMLSATAANVMLAQGGTVEGRVTEDGVNATVAAVQVSIPELRIGMMTAADGRFQLRNVPPGTHEIRVRRIGYKPVTQTVTVREGETANAAFTLVREVLALDEIVVTGTAGESRKREVGNSIAQINIASLRQPVTSMDNILQAKTAGMTVSLGSGVMGSGAQIRLRGVSTVAMSTQPLVYVDGIRVRSDGYPQNTPTGSTAQAGGTGSPIDDLNPADIERVEIIKGPAATTLYGTEAAAGVIQIFTKRGATGKTTWTFGTQHGQVWLQQFGPDSKPFYNLDSWGLRRGWQHTYDGSVAGGTGAAQYYLSVGRDDNKGVLPNDNQQRTRLRGNLNFTVSDNLTFAWSNSFSHDDIENTPAGNSRYSFTSNVFRLPNNFIGGAQFVPDILKFTITGVNTHFITGLTASHTLGRILTNKVTVGYDLAQAHQVQTQPYGVSFTPTGSIFDKRWQSEALTFDYVGSLDLKLGSALSSKLSWGAQSVNTKEGYLEGQGTNFPGPGDFTVSGAATRLAFVEDLRVINAGLFLQNVFGFRDRYFLTGGLRVDGNSAFGEDFGLQPYPKVSLSYVVSDEPFWPRALGQVKLRAAYGHAGRAPGAFDAVRTWQASGFGSRSAFLPLNVGNPDLGPERTAELEAGFDGSFLNERVSLDFTYYNRRTVDALFQVTQAPTDGFSQSQLQNVGKMTSKGIEVALNAVVLRSPSLTWEAGATLSTNKSKVLDLGDAAPFSIGSQGWIEVGHEVPAIRGTKIANPTALAEPILQRDVYFGPNEPTLTFTPHLSFTLPWGLQLSARGEYSGGNYIFDNHAFRNQISAGVWPFCDDARAKFAAGQRAQVDALHRAWCDNSISRQDEFIWPADYFKLRDVTVSLPIGRVLPRVSSAILSLSGKNLVKWINSDCLCIDPEMVGDQGVNSRVRNIGENIPTPASFVASLRIVF